MEGERGKLWTPERNKLLLAIRLKYEEEFNCKLKKRTALWDKVLEEIKETDALFPFSREESYRKFLNFMTTYKRIKRRNTTSSWEYFEMLDEVYAMSNHVTVSDANLISSIEDPLSVEPEPDILVKNEAEEYSTRASTSTSFSDPEPNLEPPRKRKKSEMLKFLLKESEDDKQILKDLLSVEKEKLIIEKEKVVLMKRLLQLLSNR